MTITHFTLMGALQRAEAKAHARMGTPGARFEVFEWHHPKGTRRFSIDFAMEIISAIGLQPKPIVTPENAREALRLNNRAGELAGLPIGHAWVETDDTQLVFDVANGRENVVRRRDYYRVGQCRDVRRYNFDAMRKMMLQHEHYGPWHETDAVHRDWKPIRKKSIDTKQARC